MKVMFDLDGTICDLYGVENWLPMLRSEDTTPYRIAKPLCRMSDFARTVHQLQHKGIEVGVISWLSKNGSEDYNKRVTETKIEWLKVHLPSVQFDEIHIIKHGVPKNQFGSDNDILFDDEEKNRVEWNGIAYDEKDLIKKMRALL